MLRQPQVNRTLASVVFLPRLSGQLSLVFSTLAFIPDFSLEKSNHLSWFDFKLEVLFFLVFALFRAGYILLSCAQLHRRLKSGVPEAVQAYYIGDGLNYESSP